MSYLFYILLLLMAATLMALVFGLLHLLRGKGDIDQKKSNKLMQWRIGLQALALAAFAAVVILAR